MTILDEPGELTSAPPADRRRPAVGPHLSWASARPFVEEPTSEGRAAGAQQDEGWTAAAAHYVRRAMILDALLAVVVVAVVALAVDRTDPASLRWGAVTAAVFWVCVAVSHGYERRSVGDGPGEFRAVLRAGVLAMAVMALGSVALGMYLPRTVVFATMPPLIVATAVGRYTLRRDLHIRRARGEAMSRTLVVGDAASVHRVIADLRSAPYLGYRVIGVCLPSIADRPPQDAVPTLGALADIPQVAHDHRADVVIVCGSELAGDALRRLSWALGGTGAQLVVAPGLVEVLGPRVQLKPTAGLSLLEVQTSAPRSRMLAKSALDRTLGGALLLAAAPVIAVAALAVRFTSPGRSFFPQRRIGIDGRVFTMWKLRSMYTDAEARRAALLAQSDRDGLMFKMRDDPRVTSVGRILRRYSIDELPQLWNVVRGDMSLVGPRPPLPAEVDSYHDAVHRRLRVRPGMTGLWQVSGRADLSWDESVRLDLRYVDNWSVAMDLLILWKTGRAVFGASGAY
ncbi:exopolysaccharide biosynthesis polyprenyl glycosylphosphotransferase [Actinomycetota bacterium]|nr:exopolysaccharide biosynthesis polyprenyl glycosylphosphotransferase [Actinomycetota bacterium]